MRKPIFFVLVLIFLTCAPTQADNKPVPTQADNKRDKETLTKWRDQAQSEKGDIYVRLGAIDRLGDFQPGDDETLMYLKSIYKDLLAHPAGDEYKHNLIFYHVAQALGKGKLGAADLEELLPYLNDKRSRDRILREEIDKIGKAPKDAQAAPQPARPLQENPSKQAAQPKPPDHIDTLILIVQDDGADINMLIIAARELGILGKDKKLNAGQQTAAENALKGLLKKKVAQGDEALKCVVEKALAQVDP